jgi:hypothetical protein
LNLFNIIVHDGNVLIQMGGNRFFNSAVKMFVGEIEKKLFTTLKSMPQVSLESYENDDDSPFLQLVYLSIKGKKAQKKIETFKFCDTFKRPFLFDFEFDHFSQIINSKTHWEQIYVGNKGECLTSSTQFFPNSKVFCKVTNLMFRFEINIPLEKLCSVIYSFKNRITIGLDSNCTYHGVRKIVNATDISDHHPNLKIHHSTNQSVITETHMKIPFPMNTPQKQFKWKQSKNFPKTKLRCLVVLTLGIIN